MTVRAAIITAAGSGSRLGWGIPKALVPVDGVPMVAVAASLFADFDTIIVTAPTGFESTFIKILESIIERPTSTTVLVVTGGATRSESIAQALAHVPNDADVILVHDAARPFTPVAVINRVLDALAGGADAVVPVEPVTDSLKRVIDGVVTEHLDRSEFARAQTPQGFRASVIRDAYASASAAGLSAATDDVTLVAGLGTAVVVVDGDARNLKITTAEDLRGSHRGGHSRAGFASDTHAFGTSGELALAGLIWPNHPALVGHSDGDAAIHALADAFLSAAGLGDLGAQFGTDRPEWKGASSVQLLRHSIQLLADAGWVPTSAQVQIIGNQPRFARRREEAQELLTSVVGVPVFISATTTDGLGFTGRGEGIAATAMVLIERGDAR